MFPENRRVGGGGGGCGGERERLNLANESKVITANSGHAYEINKQIISFVLKVGLEKLVLGITGQEVHDSGSVPFSFQGFFVK